MNEIKKMILAANAQAKMVNELGKIKQDKYSAFLESQKSWEVERAHWRSMMMKIKIKARMLSGGLEEEPSA